MAEQVSIEEYWTFFQKSYQQRGRVPSYSKEQFFSLWEAVLAHDSGSLLACLDQSGQIFATAGVLWDSRRMYNMFNTFDPGTKFSTLPLVTLHTIELARRKGLLFDFEGSLIPGVASYNMKFNSTQEPYFIKTLLKERTAMIREIYEYLIRFLLGENYEHLGPLVSYGPSDTARVIIEPSGFFDEGVYMTEKSLPVLPLPTLDGVPILFGTTDVREENGQLHIGADLIASAFFLLSRYEECVRRDVRDQHGRFVGRESLPYRAGFLDCPIAEEYGALLRGFLRRSGIDAAEPAPGFRHIWLTHDVDQIHTYGSVWRVILATGHRLLKKRPDKLAPLRAFLRPGHDDPAFSTFSWLLEQDACVRAAYGTERCTPLYFFMGCTKAGIRDNGYASNRKQTASLMNLLKSSGCKAGYHVSYSASLDKAQLSPEIALIQELSGQPIVCSRNHYLASREPEDFRALLDAGITDDFTMGYADVAGFRLGTCRSVRWIDPIKLEVTPLTLHPMTVMECTLNGSEYMNIQEEDTAFSVVSKLLHAIHSHYGEAVLLWHSPSVFPDPNSYQRRLYERVLSLLTDLA